MKIMSKKIPQKKIDRFKLKKPVKIRYASSEEVAAAAEEVLKKHPLIFEWLAKEELSDWSGFW